MTQAVSAVTAIVILDDLESECREVDPAKTVAAAVASWRKLQILKAFAPGQYRTLSRSSGIPRQHVSRILRGLVSPTLPTIVRLARAAGVSPAALLDHLAQVQVELVHKATTELYIERNKRMGK